MAVLIDNQQKKHPIEINHVQKTARAILSALGCPDGELSVVLVDDTRIEQLNVSYLGHEGPTNVISFPMREGEYGDVNPELLGDVVISMDTCAREAQNADLPMDVRFYELLIHGILHLFGYDHTQSAAEEKIMEDKSRELLSRIGV
jgi:probable rRNA maturation factor